MARIIENEKGFKVIEMNREEIAGLGGFGICDACNETSGTGYYVAVLNRWLCPKCYQEWYEDAEYYKEDARIEQRNFDFYVGLLGSRCER